MANSMFSYLISQAKQFSLRNPHFDCLRNPSGLKIIFFPHFTLKAKGKKDRFLTANNMA